MIDAISLQKTPEHADKPTGKRHAFHRARRSEGKAHE